MSYPLDATGTTDQRRRNAWSKFWKKVLEVIGGFGPITPIFNSGAHTVTLVDSTNTTRHTFTSTEADDIIYCSTPWTPTRSRRRRTRERLKLSGTPADCESAGAPGHRAHLVRASPMPGKRAYTDPRPPQCPR